MTLPEREDPLLAEIQVRQFPQPTGAAPHYLRCVWFRGDARCVLASGHPPGKHDYAETPVDGVRSPA